MIPLRVAQDLPELLYIGEGLLLLDSDLFHKPHKAMRLLSAETIYPQDIVVHRGAHDQSFFIA